MIKSKKPKRNKESRVKLTPLQANTILRAATTFPKPDQFTDTFEAGWECAWEVLDLLVRMGVDPGFAE